MKVVSNKELRKIPVYENGEKLVNLKDFSKKILIDIDPMSRKMQKLKKGVCYVREGVAKRLVKAQKRLPRGCHLKIEWAYHNIEVQRKVYLGVRKSLKRKNPSWSEKKLIKETELMVAPPDIAPHVIGAAVDLTIADKSGKNLDMGQRSQAYTKASYTNSSKISKEAQKNRQMLIRTMGKAGFVNYPVEWWHWSYGDRDWAVAKGRKRAIYGPLESFG